MPDKTLVTAITEAILHLKACSVSGCPDCIRHTAVIASALADGVEVAAQMRQAALSIMNTARVPQPPTA